jgi:hypothetical protein
MVTSVQSLLTESNSQMPSDPGRITRSPMRGLVGGAIRSMRI